MTGAKTVVQAVRQSKMVADAIDEYVTNYVAGERARKGEIDPLEGVEQPQDPKNLIFVYLLFLTFFLSFPFILRVLPHPFFLPKIPC